MVPSSKESPKTVLKHRLSLHSTPTALDNYDTSARTQGAFRAIGKGACGEVFETPGSPFAFKVAFATKDSQLWNDYTKHQRVIEAFRKLQCINVLIPSTYHYMPLNQDPQWWEEASPRFPSNTQPNDVLVTERISPLPEPTRNALIDKYCPENLSFRVKQDPNSKDCLARIYLGRRRDTSRRPNAFFTLRNFPLHIDQMEDLGLDTQAMTERLAEALSLMHWAAKVDANDVEFVLGSAPHLIDTVVSKALSSGDLAALPPRTATRPLVAPLRDICRQNAHIWLLDFNQVQDMAFSEEGVKQAVAAFFRNDPYFPRPLGAKSADQELWTVFQRKYLAVAAKVLEEEKWGVQQLPGLFVQKVVEEQQERLKQRAVGSAA